MHIKLDNSCEILWKDKPLLVEEITTGQIIANNPVGLNEAAEELLRLNREKIYAENASGQGAGQTPAA